MAWQANMGEIEDFQDEHPDPTELPEVTGYNVLIRPVAVRTKTAGGIILTNQMVEDAAYLTNAGRVVAMGPLAYDADLRRRADEAREVGEIDLAKSYERQVRFTKPWCDIGDTVVLPKHSGTRFKFRGILFVIIQDDKITLKIPSAADIDPHFVLQPASR